MDIGKCMHGNGPECERCKAMDIPEVEEMEVTITELRAEVERLRGESSSRERALRAAIVKTGINAGALLAHDLQSILLGRLGSIREAVKSATARAEASEKEIAHWKAQHDIELQTADGLAHTAAGLRRALEEVRCRCSRGIDNHCPECGDDLDRVVNNGPLNDDQFDAVKAGDWYCKKCKSDAAATGFKYWLDRQLPVVVYQTCDRCTALAASSDEHERRIKAEALRKAAEYATSAAVTLPLPDHTPTGEYVLYGDRCRVAVAHGLLAQADRLEKEAANENT